MVSELDSEGTRDTGREVVTRIPKGLGIGKVWERFIEGNIHTHKMTPKRESNTGNFFGF